MRTLAVVGHGMVATRLLEQLVEAGSDWRVVVLGEEPRPAYDRIALSAVVAGERSPRGLLLRDERWYQRHRIDVHSGCRVLALDPGRRRLRTGSGELAYDACVLATGSLPLLPIAGLERAGALTLRTLDDAEALLGRARAGGRAVVVGGGLLGLEAARGLLARGMDVTVVHLGDRLMERQLDPGAGALLRAELEAMGMRVRLAAATRGVEGTGRALQVVLADGSRLPAELVVVCAGVVPNVELAAAAGLPVGRGVLVDDGLATPAPGVFAIGECAEHQGRTYGMVAPLYLQAAVLASRLAGEEAAFAVQVPATRLKAAGVDLFAGGQVEAGSGEEEVVLSDGGAGLYKKLVLGGGRVRGAILLGDLAPAPGVAHALAAEGEVPDRLALLGVGEGTAPPPAAALPGEAVVCGCNGITKAAILDSIRSAGCRSLECVRSRTGAASACGSCAPVVEALLEPRPLRKAG